MCGFPLAHLDRHLKTLVMSCGRFVALCEEFSSSNRGGSFTRRVVRVVTPGTLIDESFVNPYLNNYLLAIHPSLESEDRRIGLAWMDVSTGEFFSQPTTLDGLRDDIARINPRETVMPSNVQSASVNEISQILTDEGNIKNNIVNSDLTPPDSFPTLDAQEYITDDLADINPQDISSPAIYAVEETLAIRLLTSTLNGRLLEHMPRLPSPTRQAVDSRMQVDSHTIHALEIKDKMLEGGPGGSLLSTIKRTVTSGGTRLLARWLCGFRLLA
jgi:DNA mismatch repair ATPase MutS